MGCILPPAIFKHVFDEYNCSIILNLFDNNKPYALSTNNQKCTNKCIIFGETLRFKGKNFNQNLPKTCSKSTKWPLQYISFTKFFRGTCPRTPLEPFLFSICFKTILPEKKTFENMSKFSAPLPEKFLNTSQTRKNFLKSFLHLFWV